MTTIDISKEIALIWNIANRLRGTYQSDKYKNVIIPMTIIRRFECALEASKDKVVSAFEKNQDTPEARLKALSGLEFYNTSKFSLKILADDPKQIADNFKFYIESFSKNAKEIILNLDFIKEIDKMDKGGNLYSVVKAFSELDLDPKKIDNHKMGYLFEDIIRRFYENAEAGDHFTGRDIVSLMVKIFLSSSKKLKEKKEVYKILDQACGTGGMLSVAHEQIKALNENADVFLYGQEINPESYAICKADMLIKGQKDENIRLSDTLKKDEFDGVDFDFVIENPPFGISWGGKDARTGVEIAVRNQATKTLSDKENGRFLENLPATSDSQMLFTQSALNKINENGKVVIIQNGSPLFSGGTSSGESQIRRYLLENDYLESIIALPTELFYNTGIATYIWVLSKNKESIRKGKIALIDASSFYEKLRKAMGYKRNELSKENIEKICSLYLEFQENEFCKIYDNNEFIYKEYSILTPLQKNYSFKNLENLHNAFYSVNKLNELIAKQESLNELTSKEKADLSKLENSKEKAQNYIRLLENSKNDKIYYDKDEFIEILSGILDLKDKKDLEKIANTLSENDENAPIQKDKKGNIIYDKDSRDSEIVPINTSIDEYMKKEVLPHLPLAKAFDENKIGAEIPFTRYFYKYTEPKSTDEIKLEFQSLEKEARELEKGLFDEN